VLYHTRIHQMLVVLGGMGTWELRKMSAESLSTQMILRASARNGIICEFELRMISFYQPF